MKQEETFEGSSEEALSFESVVVAYQKTVYELSYRFLLHKGDAEDLTQEIFIDIYQNLSQFRGASSLKTWVTRIAIHRALAELRKRKRRHLLAAMLPLDAATFEIPAAIRPEEEIMYRELLHQLKSALNQLPEQQRIAFTLSRVEGYGLRETAEIMGITEDAVSSLITRAKQKIKKRTPPDGNPFS